MKVWHTGLLTLLVLCTGCANNTPLAEKSPIDLIEDSQPVAVAVEAPQEEVILSDADLLTAVALPISCLNQCYTEDFTTVSAHESYLMAGYTDQSHYQSDFENPAVLFHPDEREVYGEQYYLDPSEATYDRIMNYTSEAEIESYLLQYLDASILDDFPLAEDFFTYEDAVYLVRGARGYGAYNIEEDSAQVVNKTADSAHINANLLLFGEVDGIVDMHFTRQADNWRMTQLVETRFAQ